ncbi:MAG: hypothetical protein ACE5E5_07575 [Phycisphaerae bacterium]
MRKRFVTAAIGLVACVAAGSGGCAANASRARSTYAAQEAPSTPQDKTHEDQLTAMQREDAQSARTAIRKIKPRENSRSRRRTGQGVVDQPIRR